MIKELLITDRSYVVDLRSVVTGYMEPMADHPDPQVATLGEELFQDWFNVSTFHSSTFQSCLEEAAAAERPVLRLATVFIRYAESSVMLLELL